MKFDRNSPDVQRALRQLEGELASPEIADELAAPVEAAPKAPPMRRREPVAGVIRAAIAATTKTTRAPRRHPADVTADRLVDQYEQYFHLLTPAARDAISTTIYALRQVSGSEP